MRVRRFFIYFSLSLTKLIKIQMKATQVVFAFLLVSLAVGDSIQGSSVQSTSASDAFLTSHILPIEGQRTADNIYGFVDNGLKEKYWYYLTKASLIYVAAIDQPESYQFLAIYRNIVGTFLAITTWKNQASVFTVNTLVRLGNGYSKDSHSNYQPVNVQLNHFRYSLGQGQYLIDVSSTGSVTLNGQVLSGNLKDNINRLSKDYGLIPRCKDFSAFARKRFWYYLEGATVVYSYGGVANDNSKNYCLVTYVNIVGTFFVIGNQAEITKFTLLNTFVRLGNGYESDSGAGYQPIVVQEVTLPLNNYQN